MMMGTEQIKLSQLKPHPKNVRQGDVGAISESLQTHGQYRPIVVQKSTNHILAGNHTYKAAKALGWKEISVTYIDVDDEKALRILLVDNRVNDLASYNESALVELIKELAQTDQKLTGTGFDGDALDQLITDMDNDKLFKDEVTQYTQTLKAPQYEIVGEEPNIQELFDLTKYNQLINEINKTKLDDQQKKFLTFAASRHIVFNYSKIAEFYPHQNTTVQQLMETSALVIIDAEDAIANGYAVFAKTMTDLTMADILNGEEDEAE
jgi:hypothetical protein